MQHFYFNEKKTAKNVVKMTSTIAINAEKTNILKC